MEERAFSRSRLQGRLRLRGLLLLLCLGTCGSAHAQRKPYAATVTAVHGTVNVRRSGGADFAAAAVKTRLAAGDIVQTGDNSRAVLLFSDGSRVKLNAATLRLIPAGAARLRLQQGEVYARTAPGRTTGFRKRTCAALWRWTAASTPPTPISPSC